jgi:hypothetical protein
VIEAIFDQMQQLYEVLGSTRKSPRGSTFW